MGMSANDELTTQNPLPSLRIEERKEKDREKMKWKPISFPTELGQFDLL